jgi:hypothetical protein
MLQHPKALRLMALARQRGPNNDLPSSCMLRLLYVESTNKEQYDQWLRDRSDKLHPAVSVTAQNLEDMDTPTKQRHDISFISQNLESWKWRLEEKGNPLPPFSQVRAATDLVGPFPLDYEREVSLGALTFGCAYRTIKTMRYLAALWFTC